MYAEMQSDTYIEAYDQIKGWSDTVKYSKSSH